MRLKGKGGIKEAYDVVIIGGGIGGLLAAANLARPDKRVCVIEQMQFLGGRFTSIPYKGFQISTGAVHMLPHGSSGPMGKMLTRLIHHPIADLKYCYYSKRSGGELVLEKSLRSAIRSAAQDDFKIARATMNYFIDGRPKEYTALEYLMDSKVAEPNVAHLEKFTNFTLSMTLEDISAYHLAHVFRSFLHYWTPGVLKGGCAKVVESLVAHLRSKGVDIFPGVMAQGIEVKEGLVRGVDVIPTYGNFGGLEDGEGHVIKTKHVISDIGPKTTKTLLPKFERNDRFWKDATKIEEASGFKFHVNMKRPPLKDASVVLPTDTTRIGGWAVVSNADRTLAPKGGNLLIAHAVFRSKNLKRELDEGILDLERVCGPDFEFEDILSIGTFSDQWPVNRAAQGFDMGPITPISGLYLVGDACKPVGLPMLEGVAGSVLSLMKKTDILKGLK